MYRTIISRAIVARPFSMSHVTRKTAAEKVSEVADKVNKSMGKGLASAIETGEHASQKTKEAVVGTKGAATEKAEQAKDMASEKADKASAELKEAKDKVKDTAQK